MAPESDWRVTLRHAMRPSGIGWVVHLLVEPQTHELGLGTRLVDDCLHFARQGDYQTITLWSNSVRLATRRIYEAAGFWLVHEESHHSFGPALIGETWELQL